MRLIQSALLGSAAAFAAIAGAQAADLPSRKAAPVEYVKICDVYGAGFYYIPGTNTCLKVGGRVRFELGWHKAQNTWIQAANARATLGDTVPPIVGNPVTITPGVGQGIPLAAGIANFLVFGTAAPAGGTFTAGARQDTLGWRSRAYVNLDARTQTAWGTVQTVVSISLRSRSGIFVGNPIGGPGGQETASPQVYAAYIRFAGFTVGRAPWLFASNGLGPQTYWTNFSGGSAIGSMQLSYTANFGGGFSATIGLEDKDEHGRQRNVGSTFTNVFADGLAGVPGAFNLTWTGVTPNRMPNAVLVLRLDQGWGHVQVSGAVGQNYAVYNNGNFFAGTNPMRTIKKTGWAVGADASINLPSLARGDVLYLSVGYGNGLIDYPLGGNTINGSVAKDGRVSGGYFPTHSNLNTYACGSFGGIITAVCTQNTTALAAMVGLRHYWTPTLRSNFAVSYASINPGKASQGVDWFLLGGAPKSNVWQGTASLIWSPTAGFDIGLELYYAKITNKLACGTGSVVVVGYVCTPWGSLAAPSTIGVAQNPTDFSVKRRVERTF
ncbi:MAG: porin [Rhizobiaceae bacterium]